VYKNSVCLLDGIRTSWIKALSTQANINSTILAQLNRALHPLGVRQLSSLIRCSSNAPDHIVLRHLRQLSLQGKVELVRGGWQIKRDISHPSSSAITAPKVSKQTQQLIWNEQTWFEPREESVESQTDKLGRWGRFRKLVKYYTQCIRNEEGADAHAYLNQQNKTFFFYVDLDFGSLEQESVGRSQFLQVHIFLILLTNSPVQVIALRSLLDIRLTQHLKKVKMGFIRAFCVLYFFIRFSMR